MFARAQPFPEYLSGGKRAGRFKHGHACVVCVCVRVCMVNDCVLKSVLCARACPYRIGRKLSACRGRRGRRGRLAACAVVWWCCAHVN